MKKLINALADILLLTAVFMAVDLLMENVFHSESLWLDLGLYLVLYAAVFGAKKGIGYLLRKHK